MPRTSRLASIVLAAGVLLAGVAHAAWEDTFAPDGRGPLYAEQADGRRQDRPVLAAYHLRPGERIEVDGRLDDAVWGEAAAGYGLVQHEPERRAVASVQTVFKIAYDDENLYLAAACWEHDMADVARRLSRRDDIQNSDFVSLYLDPYHDHLSGYNFRVTADGVKADHYLYEDTGRDTDWNAVWEACTTEDQEGWYLEIRVPLAAMRFRSQGSDTWGLQFYRWLHGRGEDTGWATSDRDQSGFVSRWGVLSGMGEARSPRRLEVTPYVAAGLEDRALPDQPDESYGRYLNLGADLRYNLTSALTAQVTVQPDFGQVEADPAVLNLSPFETFFSEQRPFFVEGARFFEHPHANLFYSRRIGTGEPGSRIRAAAKLTGKLDQQTNIGLLGALTDVTHPERVHNPFVAGERRTGYAVARGVREFAGGKHRLGLMGTGVWRAHDDPGARDAFSLGTDGEVNLGDRDWRLEGSLVATFLDPHDPTEESRQGTASEVSVQRTSGNWLGGVQGVLEHDRYDPNDIGYLSANDEMVGVVWGQYRYDADGARGPLKASSTYVQARRSWLYGDQRRLADDGAELWAYGKGHPQSTGFYLESWNQTHGYSELRLELDHSGEGTSKYDTRWFEGRRGPLMTVPARTAVELSLQSDWRRKAVHQVGADYSWSPVGDHLWEVGWLTRMDIGRHLAGRLSINYQDNHDAAHWLLNEAAAGGIGGVAYVFAELDQQTVDATLRASWLPGRDLSVELYVQPYLTAGSYRNPRFLATPDTRDLRPYDRGDGTDPARDHGFTYAALNLNLVMRWEYSPGSTVYLVFTHGRESYDDRGSHAGGRDDFDDRLRASLLFDQEPRSTVLFKVNHWFSL
ncbi:MAG: DUF5916 domain-containing protein [Candidatus Krumholzibacteriia bacterium]